MENEITNITLTELSKIEKLSIRTQNICRYNGLLDTHSIIEYYSENGTFLNARNCGRKSHLELLQIYEKYKDFRFSLKIESNEVSDSFEQTIETLTARKKLIVNNFIESKLKTLSVRGGNALKAKLGGDYSLSGLKPILLLKKAELMRIQFIGNETISEIVSFVDEVNEYVKLVSSFDNESEISFEVFKTYLFKKVSLENSKFEEIATDYDFSKGLPVFKIINVLLENYCLFGERETQIFKLGFNYFKGMSLLSIDEIAEKLNLSRERTRQLKVGLFENLNTALDFVKDFECSGINLYGLDINSEYILINDELETKINKSEQTNFNSTFITKIFSVILSEKYSLIGDEYGILFDKTRRNSHNWSHTYLISKNHLNKTDLVQSLVSSSSRLYEKIDESYSFHFQIDLLELKNEKLKTYLFKKFSLENSKFEEIATDYDFSKGLPVFKIINVLLENYCLFGERETQIFKLCFNYFNGKSLLSLDEIEDKLDLSRERTRQLKVGLFENLNTTLDFVREFEYSGINLYGVDINSEYIVIDKELENEINKNERTNFNSLFITKILSIILGDKYSLIGDEYGILFEKTHRNSHNWNHTYLVSKNYSNKINFVQFIENASSRLCEKIEESYLFHFQTYLLEFKNEDFRNEIDKIAQIAEYILFQECGLSVNIEDRIEFARNTHKPIIEYVYEALEENNKPLTVCELYNIIEEKHPGITKSADALRGNLIRATNLIYFGRSSTYGLKIWEDEQTIKGGTIRDIVEEFLENQDTPIHIDKVTEYVNQFRNTNSKNIYSNLQMHEGKKFSFFTGLFVGLSGKEYNHQNFTITKEIHRERKTFEENFESLKQFTEDYGRLPCSNGNESEVKLYRFMYVQINKATKNIIKDENDNKITEIVSKFDYLKRK